MGRFTEFIVEKSVASIGHKSQTTISDQSSVGGRFSCVVCKRFLPVKQGIYGQAKGLKLEWYCNECNRDLNVREYLAIMAKGRTP